MEENFEFVEDVLRNVIARVIGYLVSQPLIKKLKGKSDEVDKPENKV